ncbi:MAG: DNA recombination protein RmuC [Clostridia bacterium]|nr:DNA recombination protein RmuC [Clostridia bacterium]
MTIEIIIAALILIAIVLLIMLLARQGSNNSSLKMFSDIISQNQKDAAAAQTKELENLQKEFNQMSLENEQKLENIRTTLERKITALTDENNKQLEKMRDTVDEKLQATLENRISKSFEAVQERLAEVYAGLGEMKNLASDVGDLKKVLSNVKNRGVLGEGQLKMLLEQMLSPDQYDENVATIPGSSERVEFAIKFPGEGDNIVYMPIDAKFPGDLYTKLMDAYDGGIQEEVLQCQKELVARIKSEAKDISTKYISVPHTTPYGVMFLPFEGLYAEVLRLNIADEIQEKYKVTIAGPTTISALLSSFQMGFRALAIQKHSDDVWKTLSEVQGEFDKFSDVLDAAQNKLRQADEQLEKLVGTRTRAIKRKLRDVEKYAELGAPAEDTLIDFYDED